MGCAHIVQFFSLSCEGSYEVRVSAPAVQVPRADVRLVHVAVRAEGPTRALSFSDSKGLSSGEGEGSTLIDATAKLESLQKLVQASATLYEDNLCVRTAVC